MALSFAEVIKDTFEYNSVIATDLILITFSDPIKTAPFFRDIILVLASFSLSSISSIERSLRSRSPSTCLSPQYLPVNVVQDILHTLTLALLFTVPVIMLTINLLIFAVHATVIQEDILLTRMLAGSLSYG